MPNDKEYFAFLNSLPVLNSHARGIMLAREFGMEWRTAEEIVDRWETMRRGF